MVETESCLEKVQEQMGKEQIEMVSVGNTFQKFSYQGCLGVSVG